MVQASGLGGLLIIYVLVLAAGFFFFAFIAVVTAITLMVDVAIKQASRMLDRAG